MTSIGELPKAPTNKLPLQRAVHGLYHFGFLKLEAVEFPCIHALVRLQLTLPDLDKVASGSALDLDADVSQPGIGISMAVEDHVPQVLSGARTYEEGDTSVADWGYASRSKTEGFCR